MVNYAQFDSKHFMTGMRDSYSTNLVSTWGAFLSVRNHRTLRHGFTSWLRPQSGTHFITHNSCSHVGLTQFSPINVHKGSLKYHYFHFPIFAGNKGHVCGTLKCENAAICEKVAKCEKNAMLNVKIDAICEKITLNVKK